MSGTKDFWTAERIVQLRALWAEGLSTGEIGRRMSISKNAVVGKAHRENLPSRPSPIRGELSAALKAQRELARAQKAAFAAAGVARAKPTSALVGNTLAALGLAEAPGPVVPPAVPVRMGGACSYPIGEPRTPSFRYCDAPAPLGRSYCTKHRALCIAPSKERSEAQRAADLAKAGLWRPRNRPIAGGPAWERF